MTENRLIPGKAITSVNARGLQRTLIKMRKHWQIYIIILPAVIWYLLFAYYPMAGLQLAFKTYRARLGIWLSPFSGFGNFQSMFSDIMFWRSILRTFEINIGKLLVTFPVPILLALLYNELRIKRGKRIMQIIYTFPYFLSWVIVAGILKNLLSVDGLINSFIMSLGGAPLNVLGNETTFQPMLYITEIWKNAGYSSIIYLAAISGIDQDQYEAAELDGAGRWQKMWFITLPNILPTVSIMFIMATGNLMSGGFDQIFNLYNAATKNAAEVLDMYIYRVTFQSSADFGYSTAVSLFRSVINMALLLLANFGSKKLGGTGFFQ